MILWDDVDYEYKRPQSIIINLYRNNIVYDTIVISEENNWRYTWNNLSAEYDWYIKEEQASEIHTSTIEKKDDVFLITKLYKESTIVPEEPEEPEKPEEKPDDNDDNQEQKPTTPEKLPQTGLLWWPIPVCIILAVIIFIVDWIKKKNNETNKKYLARIIAVCILIIALVIGIYNNYQQNIANNYAKKIIDKIEFTEQYISDYTMNPNMEMPVQVIDGNSYIGVIEIGKLDVYLPVINECNDKTLRKAPCCYYGNIYKDNMVIAAHNYKNFFGNLSNLQYNDEIIFKDIDGNVFEYVVNEIETLKSTDIEKMTKTNADLTLFTCTYSGQSRIAVRCIRK